MRMRSTAPLLNRAAQMLLKVNSTHCRLEEFNVCHKVKFYMDRNFTDGFEKFITSNYRAVYYY